MERVYTESEVQIILGNALLRTINEAEEWGSVDCKTFLDHTSGATAVVDHIKKLMEEKNASV